MATYVFLFGALIGLAVGLLICYWKQVGSIVTNRDKLTAVSNIWENITALTKD